MEPAPEGRPLLSRVMIAACVAAAAILDCVSVPCVAADMVRVGTPEATAFAFSVLDVGVGAGIFKQHDLALQKINFAGGGKMEQGMTSGAIDMSVAGNAELAFVAKGVPQIGVAVTEGAPVDMAVIVRMDHDITSVSELKGKTIGVTSPTSLTSYLALALSQRQGWGNDGVKRAYIGAMTSLIPGLLVKNLDAIIGPVEGGLILASQAKARPLVTFGDMNVFITHVMCASDLMVKDHPERVRRFVAAWFELGGVDGGTQGRNARPRRGGNGAASGHRRQGLRHRNAGDVAGWAFRSQGGRRHAPVLHQARPARERAKGQAALYRAVSALRTAAVRRANTATAAAPSPSSRSAGIPCW